MKKYILHIFLLITAITFAQNPKVKAQIETSQIKIGEQFNLKITVNEINNVILPKLELKGLEIIDSVKTDTINDMLIQKYVITGFDSGAFYIPQQHIFIRNQAYLTDSLLVNVATVAIDTTKVKKFPIKSIKAEPYTFDDFKMYIYILLAALAIIGFWIYWFVIRKRKVEEDAPTFRVLPPYEEAVFKLNELDEKLLWQNNKVKEYYSELTEIVRGYIERELSVPALEKTTDEVVEMLKDFNEADTIKTSKETIKKLKELLQEADLVKFAKSKPLSLEIEEDRKDALDIISNLKPKPVRKNDELD
ncbi:MAG: BatD family protein [Polaribacter sp.]|nr:BatD family protein [Polaribacter sp.]